MTRDYRDFCVQRGVTLREAMKQLDRTAKQILFILDGDRLAASLTDGDLRRFLLSGGTLDDDVLAAGHTAPRSARSPEEALPLLERFDAVPVTDAGGRLLDILFADEHFEPRYPQLGLPVAVMAGGKGTRLDPYTRVLPKPLIPVGELPIIEHIMRQFTKFGCGDFHIIVNHKKQLIKAYFAENEQHYRISWYDEDKPLGTGGGLSLLKGRINSTFFLTNCDILIRGDFSDILRFHRESGSAVTMICAFKNVSIPYGVIETGARGEILAMREKPELTFQTNTGVYLVEPEVLEDIDPNVPTGFPDIIEAQRQKGRRVSAYPVSESDWLDMGQLDTMQEMEKRLNAHE